MLIDTDKIITDDDLIDFLLDRHKETGNPMFLTAANSIELCQRDVDFLNFCIDESSEWISIKDSLPEHKQQVLVYKSKLRDNNMGVYTYFEDDTWEDSYGHWMDAEDYGITHWMQLPSPPSKRKRNA